MQITKLLTIAALSFLSEAALATTVLHQIVTNKREGKPAREQATVTYLDGERFRVERYGDKEVKGDWAALVIFDGKQTYNCRRGPEKKCRTTSGGPLSDLDQVLGTPGMKFKVTSFSFTTNGALKTIAGEKCQPHKLDMGISAELDIGGIKLPGGFKPALQGKITGNSCVPKVTDWKPDALAKQLGGAKPLFDTTAAFDAFVAAAKAGAGFELEGDTTVTGNLGGGGGNLPNLNSSGSKATTKVETKKPALTADQLKIPAGFTVTQ